MADISFDMGACKFNYRVAAIIECHQRYLFTTAPGTDFWFLPGGRVKAGESSLEAIKRELQEELGLENQVVRLLWTVENFFTLHNENFHEMSFYFALSLSPNSDLIREEAFLKEPNWEFRWFNFELIQRLDLRPQFLKFKLPLTQQGFQHIIFKQEKQEYLEFNVASNRTL